MTPETTGKPEGTEPARGKATMAEKQLDLFGDRSEAGLRLYLEANLKKPVSLVLTDNSTTMMSARMLSGVLSVRLHRIFLAADDGVMSDILSFLRGCKAAMPRFRRFLRDQRKNIAEKDPNKVPIRTRGKAYDLRELLLEINNEYFGGAVTAAITWGTRGSRFAVCRRTLGSYSVRSNTIRINPLLDRKSVPRFFVAFIVYHEMLHAALGTPIRGNRRVIHSKEFRMRERLFTDYDRAMAWEQKKI